MSDLLVVSPKITKYIRFYKFPLLQCSRNFIPTSCSVSFQPVPVQVHALYIPTCRFLHCYSNRRLVGCSLKFSFFFNNHVRPHKQYLRLNLIVHLSSINLRNLHAITYRSCRLLYCRLKLHSAQCFPWHRFLPSLSGGRSSLLVHVALSSVIFSLAQTPFLSLAECRS